MALTIKVGNIFEDKTRAIVIPCDGISRKTMGALGRQMEQKVGEEVWADIMDQFRWPIPYGSAQCATMIENDLCLALILMSSFSHRAAPEDHLHYMSSAVIRAVASAWACGLHTVSMTLTTGGYRITPRNAMFAIRNAWRCHPKVDLTVYTLDEGVAESVRVLLR